MAKSDRTLEARLDAALGALEALAYQGCVGHEDHPVGSPPCAYRTPMEFARKSIAEIGQIKMPKHKKDKPKHCVIIERRVREGEETSDVVTVLATITRLGRVWVPTCLVPLCPKSGLSLADESFLPVMASTVSHLEAVHGEKITS
jgi:hypothetical protein